MAEGVLAAGSLPSALHRIITRKAEGNAFPRRGTPGPSAAWASSSRWRTLNDIAGG
jgi:hypothetical protein